MHFFCWILPNRVNNFGHVPCKNPHYCWLAIVLRCISFAWCTFQMKSMRFASFFSRLASNFIILQNTMRFECIECCRSSVWVRTFFWTLFNSCAIHTQTHTNADSIGPNVRRSVYIGDMHWAFQTAANGKREKEIHANMQSVCVRSEYWNVLTVEHLNSSYVICMW